MSRMFFAELAGKDNAVYNHFVDMFSLLSADEALDEDRFKRIIKFLASFIEKVSCDFNSKIPSRKTNRFCRTSTPNNWPASWLPDWPGPRARDNGTTSLTPLVCCRTRTKISRRWSAKVARLLRPLLDPSQLFPRHWRSWLDRVGCAVHKQSIPGLFVIPYVLSMLHIV